jgi:hypothetical protein
MYPLSSFSLLSDTDVGHVSNSSVRNLRVGGIGEMCSRTTECTFALRPQNLFTLVTTPRQPSRTVFDSNGHISLKS